jgi:hypothetical protein
MGLSGRISLNGLRLSPGPVKRIVEGDDRCGIACVAGITLREAGLAGALRIGTTALGECAGWESAGGGSFRAICPGPPLRSGLASGLSKSGNDWVASGEDGALGETPAVGASGG